MNERIKELAEQAGAIGYDDDGNELTPVLVGKDLEKFAELIVRECANFISPLGDWCGGHGEPRAPSTQECAKMLKKHFGVEE